MITVAATQPGESPGSEAWTSDPQFDDPRGGPLRARNDVQLARRHGRWNGVVNGFGLAPADVEQLLSFLPAVDGCLDKLQASR
ncbi:hypothetical protein BE20_12900 [Sorangium cellulosum]|uniref:Uncharacterized protein n=1 Tax=Sorangium cellulosum TaxID=56 RepID=A0A150SDG6_SORCE|nr:hypothetical protein BE18_11505 [Sorangium cellulosum]KYF92092.1 hypothetical protein BE20_12900 [Sorangium cellulosum]